MRKAGKLVFGGSSYTDELELDRNFGQEELRRHGVKTLSFEEFDSFQSAVGCIEKHPDAYAIKPGGETQELKQLLFVGQDENGEDVFRMLKAYEKSWGDNFGAFQLQRKVKGVEVAVGAFFNGQRFLAPYNISFEHKKLFPNELGVSTGEMGTSMFWADDSILFDRTLKKLEKTLKENGFRGHIDINSIVNHNGIYPINVKKVNGYWLVTGDRGIVTLVTGTGTTMKEAQKNMYNRISTLMIINSYYRDDIGDRWTEDSDKLRSWGYL
ncbi:MAG: hypothetical protein O3B34_05575 [Bacteroidetes bacterium]|nr:hypothetical protein [Bacteroidota bacterium]